MKFVTTVICLALLAFEASATGVSRIAFGSCSDEKRPQPVWEAIRARQPDLLVLLGDNVYADTTSPDEMRSVYDEFAAIEGFQRLRAEVPVEAIWDDHDYGLNDSGADNPIRREAQQIFLDFFEEPEDSERRRREGIYAVREYGSPTERVQLILLDTRYFKSPWKKSWNPLRRYEPTDDPDRTMLGEAQWAWLEEQLRRPARLRLIASGLQIINDEHGYEHWGQFPRERQRLFDLIDETGASGVVLLSGDRHFSEISLYDEGTPYPMVELTASGLTHAWDGGLEAPGSKHVAGFSGNNFAMIEVDWAREDPLLTFTIHGETGRVETTWTRELSRLSPQ